MPPPISVVLAPYDPEWPRQAEALGRQLELLGTVLLTVHHIGSTAVPGLAAKPVIDLLPVVRSLGELDERRSLLESLGWEWHGEYGIPGRRYCTLTGAEGRRVAQSHFFEGGSPHIERHLAFRDHLRAHPEVREAYEAEKRRARDLHPGNSHAYSDEKAAWIQAVESGLSSRHGG